MNRNLRVGVAFIGLGIIIYAIFSNLEIFSKEKEIVDTQKLLLSGTPMTPSQMASSLSDTLSGNIGATQALYMMYEGNMANAIISTARAGQLPKRNTLQPIADVFEKYSDMNSAQSLVNLGGFYNTLWEAYRDKPDFEKTEGFYQKTLELKPLDPNGLYGIYCLYRQNGDLEKASKTENTIKATWGNTAAEHVNEVCHAS